MLDTTADDLEAWHYARVDADLEQAQWEREARERAADRKAGNCWHDGGFGFRPVAFYPEQVGLTPGTMHCADCGEKVADPNGPACFVCDLDRFNCMAERGYRDNGKYSHEAFVVPPMILVSVAPPEGF